MNSATEELMTMGCSCLLLIGAFAAIVSFFGFFHFSSTGPGTHTGFITAVEQEGWFFPNYRVYVKTDNSSSQEDKYCLHRDHQDLVRRAQEASKSRQQVTVDFRGVRGLGFGLCNDVEITGIEK